MVIYKKKTTLFLKKENEDECIFAKMSHFRTLKQLPVLLDILVTVKAAPHECVIRTGQP